MNNKQRPQTAKCQIQSPNREEIKFAPYKILTEQQKDEFAHALPNQTNNSNLQTIMKS